MSPLLPPPARRVVRRQYLVVLAALLCLALVVVPACVSFTWLALNPKAATALVGLVRIFDAEQCGQGRDGAATAGSNSITLLHFISSARS